MESIGTFLDNIVKIIYKILGHATFDAIFLVRIVRIKSTLPKPSNRRPL